MRHILVLLVVFLTGCASSLEDIDYSPVSNLDSIATLESIQWDLKDPIKPEVSYKDDYVVLSKAQFAQLIDLYKYAIARRQDVDRLAKTSNAVIEDRNNMLVLLKEYEVALNATQFNLSQERSDRKSEEQARSLQLNILRLLAAGAIGFAL